MKLLCKECGWRSEQSGQECLKAPHPFDDGEELWGCPNCRGIELVRACDEPGCSREISCGFPTEQGYRNTCWLHHIPADKSQDQPRCFKCGHAIHTGDCVNVAPADQPNERVEK